MTTQNTPTTGPVQARDDGGPAFPPHAQSTADAYMGMALRDFFAAKAMQAAATNPIGAEIFTFEQRAEWAYQQADAMLKARTS